MRSNPRTRHPYRIMVGLVGGVIVLGGLAAIPLPGPGWLIVIAGLAILASEFEWARRLQDYTTDKVKAWSNWVVAQPIWVRVLVGLATFAFVYGALTVSLHLTGVPDWIPSWVPLWR